MLIFLFQHIDRAYQQQAKKNLGWAKVKAIPDERHREKNKELHFQKGNSERFRRQVDSGEIFPFCGTFAWPQKELNPASLLGMNYEELDPIRVECECFVIFSSKRSSFRVLGHDQAKVQEAV